MPAEKSGLKNVDVAEIKRRTRCTDWAVAWYVVFGILVYADVFGHRGDQKRRK